MHQGYCTLPADETGRILDRIAGLEQIISSEAIDEALTASGRINRRSCRLTHQVVLWVVLGMALLTDLPIRQVFKHLRRFRWGEKTPHRASLCHARQRLGVAPLRQLFSQVVRPLGTPQTPGVFYRHYRLVGIDGVVLDLPDTPANDAAFGRPRGGRGVAAFPQVLKLSLVELGTHVELGFLVKPCHSSERLMVEGLIRFLPPDALLLWDRGFFSYKLWKRLSGCGIPLLARVKAGLILRPIRTLSDGSYIAKIYPKPYDREKDRKGIEVRVIRYTLDDPRRVGHQQEHVILTNLFDAKANPAWELIPLYHERWEHELVHDEQKTHQDPKRVTKPTNLRSQTPCGVLQELWALSLGHFVIRACMTEAARTQNLDPDRLSFLGCLQILRCRLPECESRTPQTFEAWWQGLLWEMQQERTDPVRRNRINPRVIKRKMSKWKKKRPEHHALPPLTKTFRETVVMLI